MGPADHQRKILFKQSHQHSYKYKLKWEPVNISQPSRIENRTGKISPQWEKNIVENNYLGFHT